MKEHGVVIGGGIGGLLAGHALAERFELVTILERDHYPSSLNSVPPTRRGAPQSHCLHLLTAPGAAAFDKLVPSWREEVVAFGAIPFDASGDAALRFSPGWLSRTPSGAITYACSRSLIEQVLRKLLVCKPNVRLREGQNVLGLLRGHSGEGVAGVQVADWNCGGQKQLFADIVVDASGARSKLSRWIARLTKDQESNLAKTVVKSRMAFVSRWFHLEARYAPDWFCLSVAPTRDVPNHAAVMLRVENDYWGVALLGRGSASLPADDGAFLEYAGLCDGQLGKVLSRATPASPIYNHVPVSNRMMHYDRLRTWPEGLLALGDSVCVLDPYFGLGMTSTARGAVLLGIHLDESGNEEVSTFGFQRELASLNIVPWQIATGRDTDGRPLSRDLSIFRGLAREPLPVQHASTDGNSDGA
ncbi:NAD(P)/FAD-dependent oxidoreductase [Bradyrhizobium sp. McL0616]|uniref:NAD(P)/FAD-dependent oxidoreductase n=1 Tax=Bradyrhizobium sp. McL0616 TaxID=3415674 RepID=UPI003CED50D3